MKKTGLVMASIMGAVLLLGIFGYSLVAAEQEHLSSNNSANSGNSSQIEIEVKIANNTAYVKTEINGVEDKFTLNTSDMNTIISDIAARTGLTTQQVQDSIHFNVEDETESDVNESDVQSPSGEVESEHETESEHESESDHSATVGESEDSNSQED